MKRFALVAAILVLTAGCHAPMPSWDMFRPTNATRVAPPPTGGYGAAQPYYAVPPGTAPPGTAPVGTMPTTIAPSSAPVGTGFKISGTNRWSNINDPAIGPVALQNTWAPTRPEQADARVVDLRDADVVLASHQTAATSVPATVIAGHDAPIRILPPQFSPPSSGKSAGESLRLRGMVVNDATLAAEPRPFVPSGRVIDISQLPDAPITIRSTNTPTSTATRQSSPAQATVIDGGGWRPKTTTLRVAGK